MKKEKITEEKEVKGYKAFYFPNERGLRCCIACGALFIKINKDAETPKECIYCGSKHIEPVSL